MISLVIPPGDQVRNRMVPDGAYPPLLCSPTGLVLICGSGESNLALQHSCVRAVQSIAVVCVWRFCTASVEGGCRFATGLGSVGDGVTFAPPVFVGAVLCVGILLFAAVIFYVLLVADTACCRRYPLAGAVVERPRKCSPSFGCLICKPPFLGTVPSMDHRAVSLGCPPSDRARGEDARGRIRHGYQHQV